MAEEDAERIDTTVSSKVCERASWCSPINPRKIIEIILMMSDMMRGTHQKKTRDKRLSRNYYKKYLVKYIDIHLIL
ncbi:MAG: hypothetical protein C4520_11410 [Candidatus Abyssobacteria bacterium SURF_5]|uniref:Uncharacterized protein n=1 Tax=Abyssobacteria bacterium (strain SURF_5) TaxID=2093360 RepID=A0A3A4NR81_ABYX5|nr:MAG: hypothetical protein C4520_11410 [Candidatus Abyssubacteria bacterium SURF_5]